MCDLTLAVGDGCSMTSGKLATKRQAFMQNRSQGEIESKRD